MAGIATLSSDLFAMKEIINKYKIGKAISQDASPKEIAEAIEEILEKKEFYAEQTRIAARELCFESQSEAILNLIKM